MISGSALELAILLREHVGSDVKGVGPETPALVKLWGDRDITDLLSAIEALERIGFIKVERGIPSQPPKERKIPGLEKIAGVQVMEAMQLFMDEVDY